MAREEPRKSTIREAFGARDFMVIRFTPIGAQMLLGAPMDLLTDRTLALEDVDSPLLANLFLHDAFDRWMVEHYPQAPFERYADDAIVHCRKEVQAQEIRNAIAARLKKCGLELHPDKTKVVYCKDELRRRTYPNENSTFSAILFGRGDRRIARASTS
jgi:hypothetical protein